ncbi:hypothetical protein UK23_27900, partial [Lentzea aerocolonigenes]
GSIPTPWLVSAKSEAALRAQIDGVRGVAADPADIAYSLSLRPDFDHRAVIIDGVETKGVADLERKVAFIFPGQGSQWVGMGAQLLDESPIFAARMAECAAALRPHTDWNLLDVIRRAESLDRVDVVQPASWAMMVSLAEVWKHYGVMPDAVIGHSQGEIAAAAVSGALSLEDAAKVVALRSQAIGRVMSGRGSIVSIGLSAEDVQPHLEEWGDRLSLAATNGPRSVAVSGDLEALDAFCGKLVEQGVRVRRIEVDYASHSAQVEDIRDEVLGDLATITPQTPHTRFLSTVTGEWNDASTDALYWFTNLRQTVHLNEAIEQLIAEGHQVFVEVSSHPVLTPGVQDALEGKRGVVTGTLRRDLGGLNRVLTSLAEVWVRGLPVKWHLEGNRVDLPTYPFQHERFWIGPPQHPVAAQDPVDDAFWQAVEQSDLATLTRSLHLDEATLAAVLPALNTFRQASRDQSTTDSWRYRTTWKPLRGLDNGKLTGTWVVVTTDAINDTDVVNALGDVQRIVLDANDDRVTIAAKLVEADGIVSLLPTDERPGTMGLPVGLLLTVNLINAIADAGLITKIWNISRNALSTGRADTVDHPAQVQAVGIGWTAALEHPQRWGGSIDLPEELDQRAAQRFVSALANAGDEDQLAIRASGTLARRVVRAPSRPETRDWTPRGTTIITGGTGTLGPHVARFFAHKGAEHLVLTSRRGIDAPGARELVAELEELGTPTTVVACDIAKRDDVERMLNELRAEGREIRSVIHTAAVIGLHSIDGSTVEGLSEILAAKVDGATHLDALLTEDLDAFVLFSSISGMWGSGNHASYVAGNAYLNSLAANRRARGLRCTSVSWGIWSDDIGLGRVDTDQIRRSGLEFMKARLAVAGLQRAIEDDETEIAIANIAWDRYYPVFTAMRPATLFEELPEVRALTVAAEQTTTSDGSFAAELRALPPAEREQRLLELVRAEAASVLGMASTDALTEHRAFREVGFDSITAVDLRNKLAAATGLTLPTTMVFDHPSPLALTEFLLGELLGADVPAGQVVASAASDEPIAIIGMACRYPGGVATPEDLWNVVMNGVDAISGFPADRGWDGDSLYNPDPDAPGGAYSVQGGFLHDVANFDPGFFGISPREALSMDPQQRLLLETAWESIERAGIDPQSLKGTLTGAFIGASYQDYSAGGSDQPGDEGHMITGTLSSVLSGRVSYLFGLEGPAVTLDTACSSSLVALHLACQSLRDGESSLALAGGVSVMATPGAFVGFSRQRALAKDGRCKAYSDAADGMTLAEGVGLVLLERVSDAIRNGHRILAVVRGSAVNQDGASNGLTAPNGPSQQRVIRQALANARVEPSEVDAVDGHGTGTALGDPIEAQALLATYGQNRSRPLLLGSMKSNIGHTQMASGVASIIKMVLALRAGVLPRTLHVDQPSTKVDWSSGSIKLLATEEAWPQTGHPKRAAVSSFGLSGTNAHVVLEEAPELSDPSEMIGMGGGSPQGARQSGSIPQVGAVPVLLSARADEALKQVAGNLIDVDADLTELAASLATRRSTFEKRAVVVASTRDELVRGLQALRDDQPDANLTRGQTTRGRTAFLFTGQGSQRLGMGKALYERYPVFADALDAACAYLDADLARPLRDVMWGDDPELLNQTGYAQPAIFALEVALYRLVESWGVTPDYLAGHSIGEIAAAHVAGVLSLDDACTLISARARLMQALPAGGAMIAIQATEADITPLLNDRVSIAAINGPTSIVIAGDESAAEAIAARFEKSKRLKVSHAFHSPLMDPMLDDFRAAISDIQFGTPSIPLIADDVTNPEHWVRHVREAVRFADKITQLESKGVRALLELGPDGVLTGMAQESLTEEAVLVPALRRERDEAGTLLTALAGLHVRGTTVDWATYFAGCASDVELPTYPFQHQRFWPEPVTSQDKDGDFVDDEFWAAVEREDFAALAQWRSRKQQSTVDSWRYAVTWKPITAQAPLTGPWLVLADHDASELIEALGVETVVVNATTRTELAEQVRGDYAGVLSLLALNTGAEDALVRTSVVVQALGDAGQDAPLWVATQGAVSVGGGEQIVNPDLATVHGLGRVIALEHPQRWGGLIDLPSQLDWNTARRIPGVLAGTEDQVAVRPSGVYGRRLIHSTPSALHRDYRPGRVLVTGGTGAIGKQVAQWLLDHDAEQVILVSRNGTADFGDPRVLVKSCDVADREALAALLAEHPVTSVFHAAGVVEDGLVESMDATSFTNLLRAKVHATRNLHELTSDLDAFVLFASTAGVIGGAGQGNYAAANAFLDAFAEHRRLQGLPATSVAWGPWGEAGMAASGGVAERLKRGGITPMEPALALQALKQAIEHGDAAVLVAEIDWERFLPALAGLRPAPLVGDLPEVKRFHTTEKVVESAEQPQFLKALAGLTKAERNRAVLDLVRGQIAAVLGHGNASDVDPDRAFLDLGFDSLTTLELRNRLQAATGLTLPASLLYDYPTPYDLADFLLGEVGDVPAEVVVRRADDDPIAIVGIGCRFPGGVTSPEAFWDLVSRGGDGISSFPSDRGWDIAALSAGASASLEAGFLNGVADFDAHFFGISPREALAMDPQQRLVLETAWEALERTGIDPSSLRGSQTGVFVGTNGQDYENILRRSLDPDIQGYLATGNTASVMSGRLSYVLGLEGPAVTIDTACSSSLVAMHWAMRALRSGECSLALAGGVSVMSSPDSFVEFTTQGGLAPDGRCKAFADAADGTAWSEGAGILVLELLSDAVARGHEVLALVRGSAVNSDGASNGLTAPNGPSQQRVIRRALADAGLSVGDVDAIEAHGTGTTLGDPIEAQALLSTFADRSEPLYLGSVKSNIGHAQAAAGVAGVIKMVEAMRHGVLPRTLHVDAPTTHVDWTSGPVALLTENTAWPATGHPRRAGISAFGLSGTNAHVILE